MDNPYDVGAEAEVIEVNGLWLGVSQAILVIVGLCYAMLGLGGLSMLLLIFLDPDDMELVISAVMYAVLLGMTGFGMAGANFLVAFGLSRHSMFAWAAAVLLGCMYLMSICLPFGAVLLYALILHEETRSLFLKPT